MANPIALIAFPSREHYQKIRHQLHQEGYSSFTDDQLWYYHAYDYGWRRVFLLQRGTTSPIDAEGRWYNSLMADRTERVFKDAREAAKREWMEIAARDPQIQANAERFHRAEEWRNSPEAQLDSAIARTGPRKAWGFKSPAQALGGTPKRSAEEMKAARQALGMEE